MDLLVDWTGLEKSSLSAMRSMKRKIPSLNCYLVDDTVTREQRMEWYRSEVIREERWKELEGSKRGVLISNFGRYKRDGVLVMPNVQHNNNVRIRVDFGGVQKGYPSAKLVAWHFLGPPPEGKEKIIHRNGLTEDNVASNLMYISKSEFGKIRHGRPKKKPVLQIDVVTGEVVAEHPSVGEAAAACHYSPRTIQSNCAGKIKLSGKRYKFMFAEERESDEWMS